MLDLRSACLFEWFDVFRVWMLLVSACEYVCPQTATCTVYAVTRLTCIGAYYLYRHAQINVHASACV